jgi:hypothetical protein
VGKLQNPKSNRWGEKVETLKTCPLTSDLCSLTSAFGPPTTGEWSGIGARRFEIKGQVICKIPPNNQMLVQKSVASQSGPGGGSREAQGSEVAASDPSY